MHELTPFNYFYEMKASLWFKIKNNFIINSDSRKFELEKEGEKFPFVYYCEIYE